jgi:hypothetical protein
MRLFRRLVAVSALFALSACGGGSGGGESGRPPGFSVSTTSVSFVSDASGAAPAAQTIQGSVTDVDAGTVFIGVTHTHRAIESVQVQLTGPTAGQLTIFPLPPAAVGEVGTYTDTITVQACLDRLCAIPISGSPRTIMSTYVVRGIATAHATQVTFVALETEAVPSVQLNVQNQSGSSNYTTSISYGPGATGWLSVTPSSGSSVAPTLSLTAAAMPNVGTYTATLSIESNGFSISRPITYVVEPNLRVDASTMTFGAITGQNSLPAAATANVTTFIGSTTYSAEVIYVSAATGWLSVTGAGSTPGVLTVRPSFTSLDPGTYDATVRLTSASGSSIAFMVSYALAAASLTVAPGTQSFSIDGSSTNSSSILQRTVATGDTGATLNWTASSSVPWLTVTGSGASGGSANLSLIPSELATLRNGQSAATVTFSYHGPGVPGASLQLPVTLDLHLPTVNYVVPYVAYAGEAQEVIIRGAGFSQGALAPVMFGGVAAQSVTVRSDTEIRAVPPTSLPVGSGAVTIDNSLGLVRSRAALVVRTHPNYPFASVAVPSSSWIHNVIHDAERDAVLSARDRQQPDGGAVTRFARDAVTGEWSATTQAFDDLIDIAMSPDGKELLVLARKLHRVDPETLAIVETVDVPNHFAGRSSTLGVMNDGTVMVFSAQVTYSLLERTFVPLVANFEAHVTVSGDGSRAVLSPINGSRGAFFHYDSSTSTLHDTKVVQDSYSEGTLSRTGSRLLSSSFVRDADFALVGELHDGSFSLAGDALSPDGQRVYVLQSQLSNQTTLRIFDASSSMPVLPELSPIQYGSADYPGIGGRIHVSLDSKAIFILGPERFIVQPAP